jgi:MOSC domain-containing protein YiiM
MQAVLGRDANGQLVRKAGIMAVVVAGGMVCPGDRIAIDLPAQPHVALEPV